MMRRLTTNRMFFAAVAATALAGLSAGPSVPAAMAATHLHGLTSNAPVTVVASGLAAPRGLAWGPRGHLLVGEAGVPTSVCSGSGQAEECYGLNGSIADISSGTPVPIITGLATMLDNGNMIGPDALTYADGHLYTLEAASPQYVPSGLPAGLTAPLTTEYGALLDVTGGHISVVANPGEVDYAWSQAHENLATDFPAANPYALTANPRGGFYLIDAGANTLDSVGPKGDVHLLAFIPNTPAGTHAVPTCLSMGPDGAVYIGELTGSGNSSTAANVYRYAPWSHRLTVWQSGFSAINGCGFGANGNFYVTEYDTTGFYPTGAPDGAVIQVSPDGTRTVLGAGQLFAPSGFLAGPGGFIYVSNDSTIYPPITGPFSGEVVKIG